MPIKTLCDFCGKSIQVSSYRIKPNKTLCCSYECSMRLRMANGIYDKTMNRNWEKIEHAKRLYQEENMTIEKIAQTIGVTRTTIFHWARDYEWSKFERTKAIRTQYRKAAREKIKRSLKKGEHVHHIDGDILNNSHENLTIFPDPKTHSQCHGSLERAAFILFKKGIITFDDKNQFYYINTENMNKLLSLNLP